LNECSGAYAATREPTVDEAVKTCEREVPQYCVTKTCPDFCNALRSSKSRKDACKAGCTKTNRCTMRVNAASRTRDNEALDAQNAEQLVRCIAQTRDPNFRKTGVSREDVPWRDFQTPSYKKAIRP